MSAADWRAAIGRSRRETEMLDAGALARFAIACDDPAPPLAHWAWFLEAASLDRIGGDGHPVRGDFLPAIDLPRRMFAGAAIEFHAPLTLDAEAVLETRIVDVAEKAGGSGRLAIVTLDRVLSQDGSARVSERRTIVYRDDGPATPLPEATQDGSWTPGPVELFRFSAATFNAHRIHYDLDYAQESEGYPERVVHGPLTACQLAALAARRGPLAGFTFRATAPLFCGQPVALAIDGDRVTATRCDGVVAMSATARW